MTLDLSHVDRAACVTQFGRWEYPIWKHADDLVRYRRCVLEGQPEVIIETGTNTGDSARWFSRLPGVEMVITIDTEPARWRDGAPAGAPIHRIVCGSTDDHALSRVDDLLNPSGAHWPLRVMVSLDSDHSAAHVAREVGLYGTLVTSGCHLVIEDGVLGWLSEEQQRAHGILGLYKGTVLDAIEGSLPTLDALGFTRDLATETLTPATMHPAGWWRKS